jgi:hypothetical protein
VAWNVLEHFWPYWADVSVDWNAALDLALTHSLEDHSIDDHVITLRRLAAAAPDGHSAVTCPGQSARAFPPFSVELVEGQVVVTGTASTAVERGDVILSLDERPANEVLAEGEMLVSGSPQWRRVRTLAAFGQGSPGTKLVVRLRRMGRDHDVTVERIDRLPSEQPSYPPIQRFDDGVYYVDLSRASMGDLNALMDRLASAPGIVFDIRGRPNANDQILSHLLTRPDSANEWMAIPLLTRPRHEPPIGWDTEGWHLPVAQPHLGGRVAFLTGPGAISYAETVMGLVEHYRLGQIVGAATAGTNGDVASILAPTGCTTIFTGRHVSKLDGSRHHLIGVQPTIAASRTIAGVVARRDEVLERGLAYVRGR